MSAKARVSGAFLPGGPTWTLSGTVRNGTFEAVSGAAVEILDGGNAGRTTTTDIAGHYEFFNLDEDGGFNVRFSATGYKLADRFLTLTEDTQLDVTLPAGCQVPPAPNVQASPSGSAVTFMWSRVTDAADYIVEAGLSAGSSSALSEITSGASYTWASVAPGTYFARVRARGACGVSNNSDEKTFTVSPTAAWTFSGTVRDEAAAPVSGVTVQILTAPNANRSTTTDTIGHFSLPNLLQGGFNVRFSKSGYKTDDYTFSLFDRDTDTSIVMSRACNTLSAPSLSAAVSGTTVTFSWSAVTGAADYIIEGGPSSGSSSELSQVTSNTSYSWTSVRPGTYFVRTRSRASCGSSENSNEVTVTVAATPTCQELSAPSLSASPSSNSVAFSWSSVSGAASYVLEAGPSSGSSSSLSQTTSSNSYSWSSVSSGTYYARVRARNACGSSSQNSDQISFTVSSTAAFTFSGTITDGYNGPSLSGVTVLILSGPGANRSTTTDGSGQFSLSNLPQGGFTARVSKSGYKTDEYPFVNFDRDTRTTIFMTRTCSTLSAPSLSASVSGTTVTLMWSAVSGASDYIIEGGPSSGSSSDLSQTTSNTSYSWTSVRPGTYFVRARARSASCGSSGNSNEVTVTVAATPTCQELVSPSLSGSPSGNAVPFSWTAVTGATNYVLEAGPSSGSASALSQTTSSTSYSWSSVSPGTYFARVRARNACGSSSRNSNEISFTVSPTATFTFSGNITDEYNGPPLSGATLLILSGPSANRSTTTDGSGQFSLSSMLQGGFRARVSKSGYKTDEYAFPNFDRDTRTTIFMTRTCTTLTAPTLLSASASSNQAAAFTWSAVSGATEYQIEARTVSDATVDLSLVVAGTSYAWGIRPPGKPGIAYSARVFARNSCGSSGWSNAITFTFPH